MQMLIPYLRGKGKHPLYNTVLYSIFAWPIAFTVNYLQTGRYVRGGFTYTISLAVLMQIMDGGKGLD